jgi:hypothetical protein
MPWSSAPAAAPAVAGARASGGPVSGGKTYLVGEQGPELFTAPTSGEIVPNDRLRSLTSKGLGASGGRAPAGRGDLSVKFEIHGVTDPEEVARIAEQKLRDLIYRMESDQRGLLSD